jgi:hypothetical protein
MVADESLHAGGLTWETASRVAPELGRGSSRCLSDSLPNPHKDEPQGNDAAYPAVQHRTAT